MYSDTTIIIPTLNEASNIRKLVAKIEEAYPEIYVIIADDGSRDETQSIIKDISKLNGHIHLVDRSTKPKKGLTASVLDGVMASKTPYVIVMDADLQHPPEAVKSMIMALRKGNPVVVGTRVHKPREWGFFRFLVSDTAVFLGRLRLRLGGAYARDVVSGFFGADSKLFKNQIKLHFNRFVPEGYKVCLDLLKTLPRRTGVVEVPYSFALRTEGTSKMGKKQVIAYFKSLFS